MPDARAPWRVRLTLLVAALCVVVAAVAPVRARARLACVEVEVGLDLRALPTGTSPSGIDLFVRGQIDAFRRAAPADARIEGFHTPGLGAFRATFSAAHPQIARRHCDATVEAYLRGAPRLPVIMEPAAQITTPCRRCP